MFFPGSKQRQVFLFLHSLKTALLIRVCPMIAWFTGSTPNKVCRVRRFFMKDETISHSKFWASFWATVWASFGALFSLSYCWWLLPSIVLVVLANKFFFSLMPFSSSSGSNTTPPYHSEISDLLENVINAVLRLLRPAWNRLKERNNGKSIERKNVPESNFFSKSFLKSILLFLGRWQLASSIVLSRISSKKASRFYQQNFACLSKVTPT